MFENHIFIDSSDLESVNSTDYEDSLHEWNIGESNLNVEFEPFIMTHTKDTIFTDDLTTSSFIKEIIKTSSKNKQEVKRNLEFIRKRFITIIFLSTLRTISRLRAKSPVYQKNLFINFECLKHFCWTLTFLFFKRFFPSSSIKSWSNSLNQIRDTSRFIQWAFLL